MNLKSALYGVWFVRRWISETQIIGETLMADYAREDIAAVHNLLRVCSTRASNVSCAFHGWHANQRSPRGRTAPLTLGLRQCVAYASQEYLFTLSPRVVCLQPSAHSLAPDYRQILWPTIAIQPQTVKDCGFFKRYPRLITSISGIWPWRWSNALLSHKLTWPHNCHISRFS